MEFDCYLMSICCCMYSMAGINKHKALKIVVLENLFSLQDFDDDNFLQELENDLASECGKCGT